MPTSMTKFNPENKETMTIGDCLLPAMAITEQEDADQYYKDYVAFIQKHFDKEPPSNEPEQVARINLAYFAGYYDHETRDRIERLFNCAHLVFGKVKAGHPTPQEAFDAGMWW